MTPRPPLTLALLLALTVFLAAAARAADTDSPSDGSFGPNSPGWTAADQEDADLGAAMRAAMDKTSSPTSPNSTTASGDKSSDGATQAPTPSGPPNPSEVYGPPMPPDMAAKVKAAGLTPTPDNPLGLSGADSPTDWATKQANDQTAQLLANRGSGGNGSKPASAAPRALSNSNGNGGLQNGGAASNGAGTPGAAGNGAAAGNGGDNGPAVVSAAQGSILDVNDPAQMGQALATFAGVQKFDENFASLRRTAAPLTKTADAALGTDLPEDAKTAPKVICDHVSGRAQFDGGSDGGGCVQVQDPWKGIRNPSIKGA